LLAALHAHGLLRGRKLGIDSSVMEANASLRALEHRNTEESYLDYVRRLAAEAGIDPADTKAVRRFDKKREGRKTSNQDWQNPHDPEAKIGRTKDGATDMIYKPEHVTDLESGAIVRVEVRPGDAADNDESLCERVKEAVVMLGEALPEEPVEKLGSALCADEGYFAIEQVSQLQACGVRTVIGDPQAGRRKPENASKEQRAALTYAKRSVRSASGKALLRKRGEHLERGFCHMLDQGGLRRATLRGCEKLTKRHMVAAMTYNLSLLMRSLFAIGTPKQAMAASQARLIAAYRWLSSLVRHSFSRIAAFYGVIRTYLGSSPAVCPVKRSSCFSTGC